MSKFMSIGRFSMVSLLATGVGAAAEPGMPRQITELTGSKGGMASPLYSLVDFNGTLFFSGWDPEHGDELWRSDGSPSGTFRVADLVPGPVGSAPAELVVCDGSLFFTAYDEVAGWQLWRSDGTAGGTVRVTQLGDGLKKNIPRNLTVAGGKLYFERGVANSFPSDMGLWCSDGTAEGTSQFVFQSGQDAPELSYGSVLGYSIEWGGELFFVDSDGTLWATLGTDDGVRRIWPAADDGWTSDLCVANGRLHFIGDEKVRESDGTREGTKVVSWWDERFEGVHATRLTAYDNTLLTSFYSDDEETGLWLSDGTASGTAEVSRAGGWQSLFNSLGPTAGCGKGFLFRGASQKHGQEPWFSDGTAKGTRMLGNLAKGAEGSWPYSFVAVGKLTFFVATSQKSGEELWVTSGSGGGTRLVADVRRGKEGSSPRGLTVCGSKLYWIADDGVNGFQLWSSDGSPAGTRSVTRMTPRHNRPYSERVFDSSDTLGRDGVFYFPAIDDRGLRSSLWSTDGTAEGTWRLSNPSKDGAGSSPRDPSNASDRIFYRAWNGTDGSDLWMTDGSPQGTSVSLPVSLDELGTWMPEVMGELGGKTIVMERNDERYRGLWRYDGGGKPPVPVAAGDPAPGNPGELIYYSHWDPATGNEPWVTDGTLEGTRLLKDVRPKTIYDHDPAPDSDPRWLGAAGGKTYFAADYQFRGRELMVTDGTAMGTFLVADLQSSHGSTEFGAAHAWNDLLYFKATNVQQGAGLWRTDGTAAGTVQIKRLGNSNVMEGLRGLYGRFAELGGKMLFAAGAQDSGVELWVSDGTTGGTRLVLDICPGTGDSNPLDITAVGDRIYFTAEDGRHGRELWRSDGTPEGTVMVTDLAPGWEGSDPWGLVTTGGKLFWSAWTPASGEEPYVIDSP